MSKIITAVTPQKRNPDRVNVFLDGDFAFGLQAATAVHLRVGQPLSAADLAQLQGQDEFEQAKKVALNALARRPRSTAEVRRQLLRKGFEAAVADQVLTRLVELELLDDRAFADYWRDQRETFRPRSARQLRQELFQKGLQREDIEQALADHDEAAVALRVGAKRAVAWKALADDEFQARMRRFLSGRGFDYDTIEGVCRQLLLEREEGGRQAP